MMRLRHVVLQAAQSTTRRYPFLRRLSLTSTLLILVWIVAIYRGERSTFDSHIRECHWEKWEEWPTEAVPHHLVFVADPQLVDPHTYPGRPWPLSTLTERYTDLYMARNFRLINEKLDPDSVVFLGDLLDGGREWGITTARTLNQNQRKLMEQYGLLAEGQKERVPLQFVPGEKGRWSKWKDAQWSTEYKRFGNIFFARDQLYPNTERQFLPASEAETDAVAIQNGAKPLTWPQYAIAGGKHRQLMTSLPGNHDLGFGGGVQLPTRARFESHFGESNNVYVLGNHTFVSVDVPSLSAYDEYVPGAGDMTEERRAKYQNIWQPTNDFLNDLPRRAPKAVAEALNAYFPGSHPPQGLLHEAVDLSNKKIPKPTAPKTKPRLPVILLSHVPLFRNPDTDCGKLREKGKAISISRGYQYQNVLTPTLSSMLAKKVSAAGDFEHIFSGDDHDYCDITHRFNVGWWDENTNKETVLMRTVREITVKSFSWAMGVRKPGFLLASLWNPVDEKGKTIGTPLPTIQTKLCLLPDQLSIFIRYGLLLACTLLVLAMRAIISGLRNKLPAETDDDDDKDNVFQRRISLPRFRPRENANDRANGYYSPNKQTSETKGRQRASSTSTSHTSGNNSHLGVQRSYNARTRSVSPANFEGNGYALPNLQNQSGPLIDKAGYYPQLRWQDPDDSDEESHLGDDSNDSQAKGKKRKRTSSRARRAFHEFLISAAFVAIPSGLYYEYLIKNG